jgi:hypothetical protein
MTTPNAAAAATPHRTRKPFLWLFGVAAFLVLAVVYGLVMLGQTSRRVEKVRSSLHPGMTASQVLQNTTGWFMLYASALDPARTDKDVTLTSFHEGRFCLHSFEGPSKSLTEAELLDRIREMAGGGGWKFVFTYRGTTPARYSFAVVFSPEGKVVEVSSVTARD